MNKKIGVALLVSLSALASVSHADQLFSPEDQLAHSKEMVELTNKKEIKSKELELAVIQSEIDKLQVKPAAVATSVVSPVMSAPPAQKDSDEEKKPAANQPSVFYTGYMEFNGHKQAEMIIDGARKIVAPGDEIQSGQTVRIITDFNVITDGAKGRIVFPLQSNAQIAQKLYESAVEKVRSEDHDGSDSGQPIKLQRR